ncbi:MAG: cadherin repeat domain-containing protein [Rhodocyclaceae bacterium]
MAENTTSVTTVTATDVDASTTLTYTISGGADSAFFTINSSTGALSFASARNYESAADANGDNIYEVTVQVSDGSLTDTQAISVSVTAVNDNTPVITSNGGGATASVSIAENTTAVTTVTATDADLPAQTLTYSISGGADSALFTINSSTGALSFSSARNRESATDANSDHIYEVTVQVSDGSFTDTQAISVTITDVDEFDVGAVTDSNASANSVAENAANGSTVGITASATDADATTNTITYSLSNSAGGRFAINSSTGVVTVADGTLLNYESATSHNITVLATSADGSTSSQSFTINLTDVDEFDVGAVTDSNASANTVAENAANGSTVGITATASDADATNNAITYSLSNSAGGRFAINSSTGVVTVADGTLLNYESATSHNITVLATSADGSTSSQSFTINLTDVDEFDVGAVTDSNASANTVAENAANGSTVGITATASDADATNNAITYSLSNSAGGRFAINSSTGVVTVADGTLLNYESATSHNITVLATSADGSTSSQSFTINLSDQDEFNVGPVTDSNGATNAVNENAANGTTVGITASASDADGSLNTITYSLSDSAGGRFAINSSTGVVTVADGTLLNREAASSHSITVLATSADGSTSSQSFTINVNDVDEFDVGAVTDSDGSANTISENTSNGAAVGITASASDADATTNTITYSLDDNAGGRFTINSSTGVVTVADASLLDYETDTSHNITVRATSSDSSFSTQVFNIAVTDASEAGVGAISDANGAADQVAENAANGTAVGITASASDPDVLDTVSYSLSDDAGGRFAIDANTGIITVADGTLLNRESAASYNVTVVATSSDLFTSSRTFTIALTDVDEFDVGAVTDSNGAANSVAENAANGTTVGITASATDADATNNTITYSLSNSAGGRFAINSSTGVVTVADGTLLNYESATSHNITVLATSADGSTSSQSFTINLTDVNEFDVGAITDSNGATNAVNENAANGTAVGITASATDADATNNTITYSLSDDAGGRFAINSSTGVVTVADGTLLNRESAASHSITVLATSADGSTSSQSFTINLNDVDEFDVGAVTDSNGAANTVAEDAVNGATVGVTASATDADATTNTITYSLSNDAGGRFAINSSTGVVTVADSSLLDYESATSHNITVLATSADGSSSSQSFTINISNVNDSMPVITSDGGGASASLSIDENTTAITTVTATDADVGDTLTYSISGGADSALFTINSSTGVLSFVSGRNRESMTDSDGDNIYQVTVQVSDGSHTDTQAISVTIDDVQRIRRRGRHGRQCCGKHR